MARGHGRILSSIWEDPDFLALDEKEQRLYLFLISQPNLNHAGLLPLTLRRWARKAAGLTVADLEKQLAALAAARFIVLDDDTEELLIRSFVRNDGVWRMPKVMGAMVSGAMEISSHALQAALLEEMDRIPLDDLSDDPTTYRGKEGPSIRAQVESHIDSLRRAFGAPSPPPSGGGYETPSEAPSGTPSDTPAEGGRKASTRGRARALHARTPAPAPAPTPTPAPCGGLAQDEDIPDAELIQDGPDGPAPEAVSAQTIVSEWLDRVAKRPPGSVIGQTSKTVKQLLDDGIDPDDIRAGMARWMAKGLHPATLPSVVNEVMNAAPPSASNVIALPTGQPRPSTADQRAGAAFALAAQLRAQEGTPS